MNMSICIPTNKRPEMLEYTLEQIAKADHLREAEIVIADNDPRNVECSRIKQQAESLKLNVIYVGQRAETLPYVGIMHAFQHATRDFVTFMADDDFILPNIVDYLKLMESRPEVNCIVSDLIAWDDEQEKELHRYWKLDKAYEFGADKPLELVEFVCSNIIYPEICLYRRKDIIKSMSIIARGHLPFHMWMYQMSRKGIVRFEPEAYYREHRIVKKYLQRSPTTNLTMRMGYIDDAFRNVLETMILWALQDTTNHEGGIYADRMIEKFLHSRIALEVQRSVSEGDFIAAVDLARRYRLWIKPLTFNFDIAKAAAEQHIRQINESCVNKVAIEDLMELYRV